MTGTIRILIGFLHDLAAGGWAATMLAVFWLDRQHLDYPKVLLAGLEREFFAAGLACIAIVMATGAGRTFTYVNHVYGQEAEVLRRRLLIGKHLCLLVVFGLGTWWQFMTVYR